MTHPLEEPQSLPATSPTIRDITNLPSMHCRTDYAAGARLLIDQSYCILSAPKILQEGFQRILSTYSEIPRSVKESFSFPTKTDGFMPFGMEKTTDVVDLCERFCFRQENRLEHQSHAFSQNPMYAAAAVCEMILSAIAQRLLDEIRSEFKSVSPIEIRNTSYLQLCYYDARFREGDRDLMQLRHEDGDLITLVMSDRDGLVLFPNGQPQLIKLNAGDVVVFTGSLLSCLSDQRIAHMDHAVKRPEQNASRSSLIYFALPDLGCRYQTFIQQQELCLEPLANELHKSFGNYALSAVSNS